MLSKVHIKGFRCINDLGVSLKPLTVLVGPNDSGKSSLLRAIAYLGGKWSWGEWDFYRHSKQNLIELTAQTPWGPIRLSWDGNRGPDIENQPLINRVGPVGFFQLPARGVDMQSPGHSERAEAPQLDESGHGLPALLDHLLRRDRARFDALESAMRDLIPGFERIGIETPDPAQRRIDLTIDSGFRIIGDRASAGVRLLVFFVALAFHPSPPKLILLEEPETGVHPKRLGDVMRLLREITQGKHGGHQAQVVLTTHSPYLLDLVDPAHDQVLVFKRLEDGSRTAQPADAQRLKNFLDEFMLGEVWYNEGEEGLVARKAS